MSFLEVESGEAINIRVPTGRNTNACIRILDVDYNELMQVRVATYYEDGGETLSVVIEGDKGLLLQGASSVQMENGRVVMIRRQT